MASRLIFSLLLLLLTFSITITTTTTSAIVINFTTFNITPTPSPSSTQPPHIQETPLSVLAQPPPAHIQEPPQQQQFNAIIDSIVGADDFSNWASLLSQADPSMFPLTATLFVPENGGNSSSPVDPLLLPYHIVPRRLTFTELRQLPNGARLPTLLPGKTLLITNISASNFSVNGVVISHPDLFQSSVVSVHGIGSLLEYAYFGEEHSSENLQESVSSPEKSMGRINLPRNLVSWLVVHILMILGLHFYRGDNIVLENWYYALIGFVVQVVPVVVHYFRGR